MPRICYCGKELKPDANEEFLVCPDASDGKQHMTVKLPDSDYP